ncbi:SMP-30/gluconolactonase/LRE family protein [Knoellia sp. p5-6-4]|uniref:SMP-30/gluconolactonase/LRE family protein n=1 Tax=unclassified Knoellia TaxID=2618719 RepID=UPI0023DAE219|nr:SMP-30/gluconolactonase/LRE family protein [Knoellia sp. p5-6-4]MDF2145184.1 SMP-30/gluconolactonase/LRE family protein [Knoellia sp. p5-6-4]
MPRAEQRTDPVAHHGEGPVWWEAWGGLRYVDMLAGDVLQLRADGSVGRTRVGTVAAALRPRAGGGAVVATERAFAVTDSDDLADLRALPDVWDDPAIRFNDGGCDPDGRFWCGTMAYAETPGAGAMFRLESAEPYAAQRVWGDVTISNGLGFSPDGRLAYYNDTPTRTVSVFDYEHGELLNRRGFVSLRDEDEGAGSPDGLCVDAAGGVWVALFGGSAVRHYTADGRLAEVVELPVSQVTACTFGGPGLRELFITTSAEGLSREDEPLAGALFSCTPGVVGLPILPFRG